MIPVRVAVLRSTCDRFAIESLQLDEPCEDEVRVLKVVAGKAGLPLAGIYL